MAETLSFGNWIRQRRRALDFTQEQLAASIGCSLSAIRKIEADERRPSRQVAELLADTLVVPAGDRAVFLRVARMELGFERLGAIAEPVLVLPNALPASANGGSRPALPLLSLPKPPTPLVGREIEIARIVEILSGPECRLLTLAGPGGIGKTRLAIAAAETLGRALAGGACFVPLAAVTAPESIWPAIASALGLHLRGADDSKTQLTGFLQPRCLLLVLDNLEHLLAGASIIAELLQVAPGVRVLATSRERLGLSGEWVFDVHGLGVPPRAPGDCVALPANWEQAGAVVLFLQAARRAKPAYTLAGTDYRAVAEICQMVEGSPLGIELAAAWVSMLSCTEIADEIARSFDFLTSPARDVPPRQRSLRAAFDHSWHLLPADEREILQALSVFRGGFTRQGAEEVAGATLHSLAALMAKSLVLRADAGRYDLHEVVRQYSAEKLVASGRASTIRGRHWQYFAHLAQAADTARNGPEHMRLVEELEREHDNLLSALAYLMEHDLEEAWRMAGLLEAHWYRRPMPEARHWLTRLIELGVQAAHPVAEGLQARVLLILATMQTDSRVEMALMEQALALARKGDERRVTALALALLGNKGIYDGDFAHGDAYFAEARHLVEDMHDQASLVTVLIEQGIAERFKGHYWRTRELYAESLAAAQSIGRTDLAVDAQYCLATIALRQGDPRRALALAEPTLGTWESIHDRLGVASAQLVMARAAILLGEYERARTLIDEATDNYHAIGYDAADHLTIPVRAGLEYALGHVEAALALFERAAALYAIAFDPINMLAAQRGIADCALRRGNLATARAAIERGRQLSAATHEHWFSAQMQCVEGRSAYIAGDLELAEQLYMDGLHQFQRLGDQHACAETLEQLAQVYVRWGIPDRAAALFGAAYALREQIGAPIPPIDKEAIASSVAAARGGLDTAVFEAAWQTGTAQGRAGSEQAVSEVLGNN